MSDLISYGSPGRIPGMEELPDIDVFVIDYKVSDGDNPFAQLISQKDIIENFEDLYGIEHKDRKYLIEMPSKKSISNLIVRYSKSISGELTEKEEAEKRYGEAVKEEDKTYYQKTISRCEKYIEKARKECAFYVAVYNNYEAVSYSAVQHERFHAYNKEHDVLDEDLNEGLAEAYGLLSLLKSVKKGEYTARDVRAVMDLSIRHWTSVEGDRHEKGFYLVLGEDFNSSVLEDDGVDGAISLLERKIIDGFTKI